MKYLISLLLCALICTSCVPAAFVAGAGIGGAIIYDKRSVKMIAKDQRTAQSIRNAIAQDDSLKGTHIDVATFNQVVLLVGQVRDNNQQQTATQIAMKTSGVRRAYNEIAIAPNASFWQRSQDSGITTMVKAALLAATSLRSSQIKVVTEDQTVYLMGIMSHTQGDKAAKAASMVSGVQRVVKVFEYQH